MIRCAGGVLERGDELWLYYGGWREDHGTSRQHRHLTTPREAQRQAAAIGLAKLRLDGFVSLDAGDAEATLTTVALTCSGDALTINARADAGGYVVAEILDEAGHAVSSHSNQTCDAFRADALDPFRGRRIKLRFHLKTAALYAFTI